MDPYQPDSVPPISSATSSGTLDQTTESFCASHVQIHREGAFETRGARAFLRIVDRGHPVGIGEKRDLLHGVVGMADQSAARAAKVSSAAPPGRRSDVSGTSTTSTASVSSARNTVTNACVYMVHVISRRTGHAPSAKRSPRSSNNRSIHARV